MQAIQVSRGEVAYLADYPLPVPEAGQVLIRVTLAGICSTDLEIVQGYADFSGILGHEFVGIVEGPSQSSWLGQRVVGAINLGCSKCVVCVGSGPEHCPDRTVLGIKDHDGAFAEYLTLPEVNLVPVPDTVPDEVAVFTEPLAAALRIREQLIISPSAAIAVIGPGRLGILVGQVIALSGTRVKMIGRSKESLLLPKKLGMDTGFAGDFKENSFDIVVEVTGNPQGFELALKLLRPLGTLVMKSTYSGKATVDLSKIVVDEITLIGSRCGPFAPALRLLEHGLIEVKDLIEARYPLDQGVQALAYGAQSGMRKVLLEP